VVVTFAASRPDDGSSMRSTVLLQPAQREELSLGGPAGAEPTGLEIARGGDSLTVSSLAGARPQLAQR
jgi:hypothetical protein